MEDREQRPTVKVMWDYDAFPLWVAHPLGQATSSNLPLPDDLRAELQRWSDDLSAVMWGPKGPDAPGFEPDRDAVAALDDRGLSLAKRVRSALDASWVVTYVSERSLEEIRVE